MNKFLFNYNKYKKKKNLNEFDKLGNIKLNNDLYNDHAIKLDIVSQKNSYEEKSIDIDYKPLSIEYLINYNLIFFYENMEKFNINEDTIFYDKQIFFKGDICNGIMENGDLYNLLSNIENLSPVVEEDNIIYKGIFKYGLPFGLGIGYDLLGNRCFNGLMLNGFLFKKIIWDQFLVTNKLNDDDASRLKLLSSLKQYVILNIFKKTEFKLYKKYVYNVIPKCSAKNLLQIEDNIFNFKNLNYNNKFCNLYFSKKCNPMEDFIYNIQPVKLEKKNENMEIKIKNFNGKTLFYFNHGWQYPVLTEKKVFDLYFNQKSLPCNYFAFPWATLIDNRMWFKKSYLENILYNFKIKKKFCSTVCQHIFFRKILPILKNIGITHIFASHTTHNDYILEDKYNIKIIPFPLYPVNYNKKSEIEKTNKYLFSFIGSYSTYYITDIRQRLCIFKNFPECYVKIKNKWHFYDEVYSNQIFKKNVFIDNKLEEEIFSELLLNSKFSLCPGGSGPNSIRLWESLSYGCIPVILSNEHKLPNFINWNDFCILYNDRDIDHLYEYLNSFSQEKIDLMKKKCIKIA